MNFRTTIVIFYLISIFKISYQNDENTVIKIANNPGIYYETLGKAKVTNDQWIILVHQNISLFEEKFDLIYKILRQTQNLCYDIRIKQDYHNCTRTSRILSQNLNTLDSKFETLTHLTGHKIHSRRKRGLLNVGSYILKGLFGTPDADDAEYYNQAIHKTLSDEKQIQILMKEQVHIIKNSLINLNETISNLQYNEIILNSNIHAINTFMTQTKTDLVREEFKNLLIYHENLLTELTQNLFEEFDNLINGILFSRRNIIHPSIITPKA